ncbi:MAG: hypothetical protein HZA10_03230 [Nitrospirae bacterium]|nr:hypothetical protein [Nitrospirota bacterium]
MKSVVKKCVVIALSVMFLASAGYAADAKYSADTIQKVDEYKILKRDKKDMPESLAGITNIKAEDLKSWLDQGKKFILLDNRPADEYEKEHIPGAIRLNSDDILEDSKLAAQLGLKKDDVIANYCNGVKCWRSPATSVMLHSLGYKNINWYRDGLPDWAKKGYATTEGKEPGAWKK